MGNESLGTKRVVWVSLSFSVTYWGVCDSYDGMTERGELRYVFYRQLMLGFLMQGLGVMAETWLTNVRVTAGGGGGVGSDLSLVET